MKKVLHIANWYPNKWDNLEGIFIQEQYRVFSKVTDSHLINVQVREGTKLIQYKYIKYSENEEGYYILTKIKLNKILEIFTTFLLLWALIKSNYKKYEILHFHIAYPLLIHYFLWKKIIKIPVIISEHWSAYHFNFYMPKETKKLDGIKKIFKQNIPLITVSKALLKDIQKFSGTKVFPSTVIPNVIDEKFFYYRNTEITNDIPVFFSVNNWRKIKNPFPMLEGFAKLHHQGIDFKLVLGGYGEEIEKMKAYIQTEGFFEKVNFLGKMDKQEIADMLAQSDAYLFSSSYETFSVVCAQALCCGVPLIGPKLIAIQEYADDNIFLSLENNNSNEWAKKLETFVLTRANYNRKEIANQVNAYLSNKNIAKQYKEILDVWIK